MKATLEAIALCCIALATVHLHAADECTQQTQKAIEIRTSDNWMTCFEQYDWPEEQNVLFEPNCRESQEKRTWTPLHVAVHHGYASIARILLENGALILQDAEGKFPYEVDLHPNAAHRYADYTDAQTIVKETKHHAHTVLIAPGNYFANMWGRHDFARNPNIRDTLPAGSYANAYHGMFLTPLHAAVGYGDVPFTQELLKRGALLLRDKSGNFPHKVKCAYAVPKPENSRAKALVRLVFKTLSPMHITAVDYNTHMIEELAKIDHNYVHAQDQFGRTPLIYAVQSHAYRDQEKHDDEMLLAVVKTLIKFGSKVGREDRFGKSAYNYFAETESTSEVQKELLELLS